MCMAGCRCAHACMNVEGWCSARVHPNSGGVTGGATDRDECSSRARRDGRRAAREHAAYRSEGSAVVRRGAACREHNGLEQVHDKVDVEQHGTRQPDESLRRRHPCRAPVCESALEILRSAPSAKAPCSAIATRHQRALFPPPVKKQAFTPGSPLHPCVPLLRLHPALRTAR